MVANHCVTSHHKASESETDLSGEQALYNCWCTQYKCNLINCINNMNN